MSSSATDNRDVVKFEIMPVVMNSIAVQFCDNGIEMFPECMNGFYGLGWVLFNIDIPVEKAQIRVVYQRLTHIVIKAARHSRLK